MPYVKDIVRHEHSGMASARAKLISGKKNVFLFQAMRMKVIDLRPPPACSER